MVYFHTKNPKFDIFWKALEWKLWHGHLVQVCIYGGARYFVVFWYFSLFWCVVHTNKKSGSHVRTSHLCTMYIDGRIRKYVEVNKKYKKSLRSATSPTARWPSASPPGRACSASASPATAAPASVPWAACPEVGAMSAPSCRPEMAAGSSCPRAPRDPARDRFYEYPFRPKTFRTNVCTLPTDGVDVMITIFCDFWQFLAKNWPFSPKPMLCSKFCIF
jgi:hypothetical protein